MATSKPILRLSLEAHRARKIAFALRLGVKFVGRTEAKSLNDVVWTAAETPKPTLCPTKAL